MLLPDASTTRASLTTVAVAATMHHIQVPQGSKVSIEIARGTVHTLISVDLVLRRFFGLKDVYCWIVRHTHHPAALGCIHRGHSHGSCGGSWVLRTVTVGLSAATM